MDFASDGTYHSSGHFTVDPSRAREKLSAYLLQSQSDALLRLVQAAVQGGASGLKIRIERRCLVFTAEDCEGVSTTQLSEVKVETLTSCALNLAVQSFLHFGCEVEYGMAKDGKAINISLPSEEVQQTSAIKSRRFWMVTVWQPGNFWSTLLSGGRLRASFHKALERCRLAPLTIQVGGRRINQPFPLSEMNGFFQSLVPPTGLASSFALCERYELLEDSARSGFWSVPPDERLAFAYSHKHGAREFASDDIVKTPSLAGVVLIHQISRDVKSAKDPLLCHTAIRIPLPLLGIGHLTLVYHGVVIESMECNLGCPGAQVAVTTAGLNTDVSGLRVLQNEALEQKIRELRPLVASCAPIIEEHVRCLRILRNDRKISSALQSHLRERLPYRAE